MKAPSGKPYRVVGYINPLQLVDRVETWVDHPIFGDLHVDTTYIDFQDVDGVKVPTRTARKQAGMETFVAVISGVRVNPADVAELVDGPGAGARRRQCRRPPPRSWPTASTASPAATSHWRSSSRTTSSCSKADPARPARWRSSPRRSGSFRPNASGTW